MGRPRTALRLWPRHGPKGERLLVFLAIALTITIFTLRSPLRLSGLSYPDIAAKLPGHAGGGGGGGEPVPDLPHTRKLCGETRWTEGLSLWCHSACGSDRKSFCGGLTNARSRLQTCVRWAIDAGATEVVVPHVVGRRADYQVDAFGGLLCSDEWMDVARLGAALGANCPRLRVRLCPGGADAGPARVVERGREWDELDVLGSRRGGFRAVVGSALGEEGLDLASVGPERPVVLRYGDSYLGWNYSASGELGTIQKELFRAINYEPGLLGMGSEVLRSPKLRGGDFIGVHFRGEADWPSHWGSAEDQMRLYAEDMERIRGTEEGKDVSDVYVSCGDKEAIERFRQHLAPRGFAVHDKSSLLEDDEEMLARVEGLDFDKKAVVDYQLLSNAKYFMGVSCMESSRPATDWDGTWLDVLRGVAN